MMYFLAIFLAALTCTYLSKAQNVFSIQATLTDNTKVNVELNTSIFNEFYTCLCDKNNKICAIRLGNDGRVSKVESCSGTSSKDTVQHRCEISVFGIVCEKYLYGNNNCSQHNVENIDFCSLVTFEWTGTKQVEVKSQSENIEIARCPDTCNIQSSILATYPVSPLRPVETTPAPTLAPGITYQASSTTWQRDTTHTITERNDDNDNNGMAIIIGAVVGGAVFVVIVVTIIIIIVLRRRKKKASSSLTTTTTTTITTTTVTTTTTNNKDDDTDIYPYEDSSLSNVKPNVTFNNLNSSSNTLTPDTYATVDPSKKLNKKKPSLDTNNVNDKNKNKSKDNKNHFRLNAGYAEVDIDLNNDKDRSQSSSNANKGQGVSSSGHVLPPPPPDPSVKPKYYNTFGETGEDPSAPYAQVVKKSKNKDESAVNVEGAGSNPTREPSGYEEAVPHTDTQYAEVDLSAKAKPKLNPAPDGVYSKLHDPVRKFKDVYN